ncbi:MAG: serine/threonine protein kinase [Acidobacteria bacterium]|nr:serine/threonine protein kinase [Acidobacteriota bacterium]
MVDHGPNTETITSFEVEPRSDFRLPKRWRLDRVLGVGGQGEVWLAFDTELQERVAVKVLARPDSPTAVERLKREVRVGRKLRHEHLVQIYELVDAGASMAVVMEFLEGGNLSRRLGGEPLEISEIERIAEALLEALSCLHREGIVHRDVKPSNVLFDGKGVTKLADFGTLSPMDESGDLTATNLTVGTPAYMSPEQVRGEEPAPPSDLYSLGVTLYHLLAGKRPFEGRSEFDVARMQVTDEPPPVRRERSGCPRWLARFVHRLLEKDPKNRWKDAGQALEAFRARRWRPARRVVLRSAMVAAIIAALGFVGLAAGDRLSDLRSSVENGELVVRNAFGRTLWRKPVEGIEPHSIVMDLHEERGSEILVAAETPEGSSDRLDLLLFGRGGRLLDRFQVRPSPKISRYYPRLTEKYSIRSLQEADFGGDVGEIALWTAIHQEWYPSIVGLWSKQGPLRGRRPLFVNSGHISVAAAIDVDGDGNKELLVAGFNNVLGNQLFAALVDISGGNGISPDLLRTEEQIYQPLGIKGYVLLGEIRKEGHGGFQLVGEGEGRLALRTGRQSFSVGPDGSIDGIRPTEANRFWLDIVQMAASFKIGSVEWRASFDSLESRHSPMWARPPFRVGAGLILADALAQGGNPAEGADALDQIAATGAGMRRLFRRTGELRLLSGDREGGGLALTNAINAVGQAFNPLDELIDLSLDAALHQDFELWDEVSGRFRAYDYLLWRKEMQLAVDFFGGRFAQCGVELPVRPGTQYAVHVLKIWAAIEDGDGLVKVEDELNWFQNRLECAEVAAIARARALTLEGRADEAVGMAVENLDVLRMRAATSWPDAVMLPLCEWAMGTIYEALGDGDQARPHLEFAAIRAPETFFGRDAMARLERWDAGMLGR